MMARYRYVFSVASRCRIMDGPQFSLKLLDFLKANNERATHFLIGITMVQNVEPFKATLASGNDIAVHTYTHPYMTTLSNADVVAQLGWTMQIIHDSTYVT